MAQQGIVPLHLSISDPGARSMGFGGAFVALADDATAALANPAGLVQLAKPEVSIEGRHWSYSTPFTESGRVEGTPSGNGIDTLDGLQYANSHADMAELSFLSYAHRFETGSIAIFRHQFARHQFFAETQGLFGAGSSCCQPRFIDQRVESELDFVSYGFSVALRASEGFDLGLGVVYHDIFLVSDASQYLPDDDSPESRYLRNSYLPERSLRIQESDDTSDSDTTLTVGFLWRPSESLSVGGVYRQGLETTISGEVRAGQAGDFGVPPGEVIVRETGIPIEFPDIFGAGIAYRHPDGRIIVSLQWDHIEYSSIPKSLELEDQTADDANEWHIGAEYVFLDWTPITAIRLGAWLDPDHQLRATSDDPYTRAVLPRGADEMHFSLGVGIATPRFQVDAAADFADNVNTLSLSVIYNFEL
jgi:long-subunit fatty acid transport protein